MTWLRVDDNFADHPKIEALSDAAFRVHVRALCYAARLNTEGYVQAGVAARFGATKKMIADFLALGLWEDRDDGYMLHDFLEYNPSNAEREKRAAASSAAARARWNANRITNRSASGNANGNADGNAESMPTRPDPSRIPDPLPGIPPNPPLTRGEASAVRAQRARDGSKRKRDVVALRREPVDYEGSYERMRAKVGR